MAVTMPRSILLLPLLTLFTFLASCARADNFGFIYPNATLPADKDLVFILGQEINIQWRSPFSSVKLGFIALNGAEFIFIDQNESGSSFSWAVNVNGSGSSQAFYYLYFENQADNQQHYYSSLFRVDSPVDAAHTDSAFPSTTRPPSKVTSSASVLISTVTVGPTGGTKPNAAAASSASAAAFLASENTGLSSGAKAGIGVGVTISVLALAGAVAFFLLRRRRRRLQRHSQHSSDRFLGFDASIPANQPPQEMSTYGADDAYGAYGPKQGGLQEAPAHDDGGLAVQKRNLGRDSSGVYELAAASDQDAGTAELPGVVGHEFETNPGQPRGGGGNGGVGPPDGPVLGGLGPPARNVNWQQAATDPTTTGGHAGAAATGQRASYGAETLSPHSTSTHPRTFDRGGEAGGAGAGGDNRVSAIGSDPGEESGVSPGGATDSRVTSTYSRPQSYRIANP